MIYLSVEIGSFEALKVMLVTGAVLTPKVFEWAQEAFGGNRLHLVSSSGGTDICASCEYVFSECIPASKSPAILNVHDAVSCHWHSESACPYGR